MSFSVLQNSIKTNSSYYVLIDAADTLADVYKSAEHPDKAQEVTDSVDKLSKSVDGLQGKITSTQQDLNDKFVKSQVRRVSILDLVTQTGTYQSRKQL